MMMSSQTPRASIFLSSYWMEGVWVFLSTCTECTLKLMTPALWHLLILFSLIPSVILILRWTHNIHRRSRGSRRWKGLYDTQTASPCRRTRFFITEILMMTVERKSKRFFACCLCLMRSIWGYVWGYRFTVKVCNSHSWTLWQAKNAGIVVHTDMLCPYHVAFLQIKASLFAVMMMEIGLYVNWVRPITSRMK